MLRILHARNPRQQLKRHIHRRGRRGGRDYIDILNNRHINHIHAKGRQLFAPSPFYQMVGCGVAYQQLFQKHLDYFCCPIDD
jgi:hypothetical protein